MMPLWVEVIVAVLLVLSSLFALIGAIGLLRMKDFFQRMHPPALASTLGAWCVALASIIYFSVLKSAPVLHGWLIPILLAITVPVTTLLLARTALFRKRMAGNDVPTEVSSRTEKQVRASQRAPENACQSARQLANKRPSSAIFTVLTSITANASVRNTNNP